MSKDRLRIGDMRHSCTVHDRVAALDASRAPIESLSAAVATRRCSFRRVTGSEPLLADQVKGVANCVVTMPYADVNASQALQVTTSHDNTTTQVNVTWVDQVEERGRKTVVYGIEQKVGI